MTSMGTTLRSKRFLRRVIRIRVNLRHAWHGKGNNTAERVQVHEAKRRIVPTAGPARAKAALRCSCEPALTKPGARTVADDRESASYFTDEDPADASEYR